MFTIVIGRICYLQNYLQKVYLVPFFGRVDTDLYITTSIKNPPPVCCHLFEVGGIVYLSDPDSYVGWSFYTPLRATQARQVEGQRSDKVAAQLLFFLLSYFPPPLLSYYFSFFHALLIHT